MEMLGTSATTEEKPLLSDASEMALPEGYESSEQSGAAFAMPRIEDGSTERVADELSASTSGSLYVQPEVSSVSHNSQVSQPVTGEDLTGNPSRVRTWAANFYQAKAV